MSEEQQLDTEQLTASLDELVKAADATKLISKGGVSNSGTYNDGKPSGGGQGSMSDSGGIDALMIGKMVEAGVPVDLVQAFQAFMSNKDEDEDEMEGYMGGTPPQPPFTQKSEDASKTEEKVSKSMDELRKDSDIADAVDVSPFLEALTARTAEQLDGIKKSLEHTAAGQNDVNSKHAAALYQMGTLLKSQAQVVDALGKRLNLVERAPVAEPKGRTGAQPMHKAMPGEAGAPNGQLTKSEILGTLSYMNLEKGLRDINGARTTELIGRFEGGNMIEQPTIEAVQAFLRDNPGEAAQAKAYA